MYQKVILVGNLGADPETRYTQAGDAVTRMSVATSKQWKDRSSGEARERTSWHQVEAWGRLAEICAEYLHKGAQVFVEGEIQYDKWEQDGQTKHFTKIRAATIRFLKTNRDQQQGPGESRRRGPSGGQRDQGPGQQQSLPEDDFDDDIPF